ncbi:MAG: carboxypeptidase M32 [Candidatus Promineifilaceae bacterium]
MADELAELKIRLREINDLNAAAALLSWDQTTYMPPAGGAARGRQLATLGRLAQEKQTDPEIGRLLDALESDGGERPEGSDEAALIRVARRDFEQASRVPPAFVADFYTHAAESYEVWAAARPENDFAAVRPYLERTLDFSRRYADFFPGYDHIADPLIDLSDYGMKSESVRQLFAELRQALIPIAEAITAQPEADDSCLRRGFPEAEQLAFGVEVIKEYGYDFNRGRQDKTHHPYMTKFSLNDVRITTRVREDYLGECLFSTLHEAGHAMYEQGIDQEYEGGPLAGGTSSGVHESQSRLWENLVGRSRPFWQHYFPRLQAAFPDQLGRTSPEEFYRAINKVERSLIRTDADEVTYNLHVMIRFDLELALLEGELAVAQLPEAWHARYLSDLGLRAPDDRNGVLQDVHWYAGFIGGAFQGYTLGNVMSALFYDQALQAGAGTAEQIAAGDFVPLHTWLRQNIYRHGRKYTADELVQRITGRPLTIEPYIRYLRDKFGGLYQL